MEKLTPRDPGAYGFGGSAAVSDDGQTVLVGADEEEVVGKASQGVEYIFRPYVPLVGVNLLLFGKP